MAKKNHSGPQTFIDINGKRYDATTGKQITAVSPVINDVFVAPQPNIPTPAKISVQPVYKKKPVMDIRPAHHLKPHRPEPAKTLMRTAVTKPTADSKHLKAHTRTDILAKSPATVTVQPKLSFYHTDPRRQAHASHTPQSELVHRFAPGEIITPSQAASSVTPEPTLTVQHSGPHKSLDIFEQALAKADAHLEKPINLKKQARAAKKASKRPLHHRTTSLVAASMAVLVLTGFVAYQNKTALTVRYASAKAGFHVSLPDYKPLGFALGDLSYQTGKVKMAFNNTSNHHTYTLSQEPSNWDSQTLLDTVVASSGKPYQTIQHQGQTIYIYNDNNAAWVDGGILYQLTGQGTLSTSQVLDLASSV